MSTRKKFSKPKICCFCHSSENDEFKFGRMYELHGIVTHYFCLLLSSDIVQNGKDEEGILGFLLRDIRKEISRGKKLNCCYCWKHGATLRCYNAKCKKMFHHPCALKNGSMHQFFGEFRSYCSQHRPKQRIHKKIQKNRKNDDSNVLCFICYDYVNPKDIKETLWTPCCTKNAWFHRNCIQQLALNAGYFFKCPLCNNSQRFRQEMLYYGIYIPDQDASWEMEPHAFEDLLHRHNRCDALKCLCPKGRTHKSKNAKWELVLCSICGSQGIHMACGQLKWANRIWECNECTSILHKTVENPYTQSEIINITPRKTANYSEDSDSDISVDDVFEKPVEINSSTTYYGCPSSISNEPEIITLTSDDESTDMPLCSLPTQEEDSASKMKDTADIGIRITNKCSLPLQTFDDVTIYEKNISKLNAEDSSNEHFKATFSSVGSSVKRTFEEIEEIETPIPKRPRSIVKCGTAADIQVKSDGNAGQKGATQTNNDCSKYTHKHSKLSFNSDTFYNDMFSDVFSEITNNPNACDRPELIPKFVKLQDLKFRLDRSNNVQMILYDTFSVNLKMDSNVKENDAKETSSFNLWKSKGSEESDEDEEKKKVDCDGENDHVEDCKFRISIDLRKITDVLMNKSHLFPSDKYVIRD